jgi:hypothetical protein
MICRPCELQERCKDQWAKEQDRKQIENILVEDHEIFERLAKL